MSASLPPNPSLENLKKQAKALHKAWQAGRLDALERIRAAHPRYSGKSDQQLCAVKPRLTDCQLVLARDPAALERPFVQCLSREPKPGDQQPSLVRMVMRGKTEAVKVLLGHGANDAARHPVGHSLLQVARDKGFEEIAALLETRSSED